MFCRVLVTGSPFQYFQTRTLHLSISQKYIKINFFVLWEEIIHSNETANIYHVFHWWLVAVGELCERNSDTTLNFENNDIIHALWSHIIFEQWRELSGLNKITSERPQLQVETEFWNMSTSAVFPFLNKTNGCLESRSAPNKNVKDVSKIFFVFILMAKLVYLVKQWDEFKNFRSFKFSLKIKAQRLRRCEYHAKTMQLKPLKF